MNNDILKLNIPKITPSKKVAVCDCGGKEFDVIEIVSFDWKEISEDVIELMERTIEALGGYLQHDPTYDGSDTYGFIISKKPISIYFNNFSSNIKSCWN